ncbi:hypothetical protein PInf_008857 [Phytophthora infestans]|nr:hypothetical protein PInf_008857 [Phytophthora infestans]
MVDATVVNTSITNINLLVMSKMGCYPVEGIVCLVISSITASMFGNTRPNMVIAFRSGMCLPGRSLATQEDS